MIILNKKNKKTWNALTFPNEISFFGGRVYITPVMILILFLGFIYVVECYGVGDVIRSSADVFTNMTEIVSILTKSMKQMIESEYDAEVRMWKEATTMQIIKIKYYVVVFIIPTTLLILIIF